jgi:colanic acid biosynthesis glycosyl transferase WcaI
MALCRNIATAGDRGIASHIEFASVDAPSRPGRNYGAPMKIVLHEMGTYAHVRQLAKALASRGHQISYVYCASSQTPSRSSIAFGPEDKVTVLPIGLGSQFAKWRLVKRFVQEKAYGARVASAMARLHPDLIISGNTPIEIQAAIQKMCQRSKTPFLFWLQDVYSIGVKSVVSKLPIVGSLIAARYGCLERGVVRRSDGIVAISDDFYDLLVNWGVDPCRIAVIENWAELPDSPLPPKENDWAAGQGLLGKRILLYSGALGFKHNPQLFLELASEFRDEPDIRIVVISEGYGAEWLSQRRQAFPGLVLLPFQAAKDFPKALASADVLIAILEPDAARYSVPSKVLAYMTAGKPILAAIPAENLAARIIITASSGLIVDPKDSAQWRSLARSLMDDADRRELLGTAALAYARANFEIGGITTRFEEIFQRIAKQRPIAVTNSVDPVETAAPSR